jgi:geranylgeranyl diphosphate synthase type I
MMALARSGADRAQAARLRVLFGNPDLDAAGAEELRAIIVDTGALERIEQMIRVRADAAVAALAEAPIPADAREALVGLAGSAINRQR